LSSTTATGSKGTRWLGALTLLGFVALVLFAFVFSSDDTRIDAVTGEEIGQFDLVRIMYVHVPPAILAYVAFSITALGSAVYLWKRSAWWDMLAHAAAEIGVVFAGLILVTGSIWGKPTWNTWWEWGDVRLVTTMVLFLMYLGYLALRAVPGDPQVIARRASVVGLIAIINIPLVNRSVEWWESRTLHQKSSLTDGKLEDLTLFTLMLGLVVFSMLFVWLLIHRFRVAWLQSQVESQDLAIALDERRAEARVGVEAAVGGDLGEGDFGDGTTADGDGGSA
jgi:heme exporter protein C